MIIDIKKLLDTCGNTKEYKFSLDLENEDFPGYTVANPVNVSIVVQPQASGLYITANLQGKVMAPCARCLEPAEQTFAYSLEGLVRETDFGGDESDFPVSQDGILDCKEFAYTEIILQTQTVLLCSDKCEGLCPVCGKRKPCDCKEEEAIDERLAILKQLLS